MGKHRPENKSPEPRRSSAMAALWGVPIGLLGGLIGLGGAEFRLPVLAGVFGYAARRAVALNIAISLITVVSTPVRRSMITQVTSRPAAAQHLRDLARLRRVRDRIDREYARPLDVEALARGARLSAGHLSRQFRRAYGESPYGYLMTRRIERAMALLRRGDLSVTEVCFAVGCSSLGTFSSRFTELVGVPPSVAKQVTRPIRNREAPAPEPHL